MQYPSLSGAISCVRSHACKTASSLAAGVVATGLLLCTGAAQAVSVSFVPSDLNPGDTYHVAFITRNTLDATSTDIADYNAFVQSQSQTANALTRDWGVDWFAIASTSAVDASDNIPVDSSPVYLLSDVRIADDAADLWDGSIAAELRIDQNGSQESTQNVWTGTAFNGTEFPNQALGTTNPRFGFSATTDAGWVSFGNSDASDNLNALYAVSEELTVIPVPAAVWLFGSGLIGLIGIARRKKTA
jgi:hypothetical protein